MISASKVELVSLCRGALALPQTVTTSKYQEDGNALHAANEAAIKAGHLPFWLEETWPGHEWRAEVKFAYDIATGVGRELPAGEGHRDYGTLGAFEVPGTADIVGIGRDGVGRIYSLVIPDLKSFDPEVKHPSANKQLATLALAATRAYSLTGCEVAIKHEVRGLERAMLDSFDLDAFALDLRELVLDVIKEGHARRNGLPITLVPGKQCRWCNAFDACPRSKELVQLVRAPAIDARITSAIPCNDDATASDLFDLAARVRLLLKRIDSALHARAAERPIPRPGGKLWGPVPVLGDRKIDGNIAHAQLLELHGQLVADAAITRTTSQKAIEDALRPVAGKGQLTAIKKKVIDAIDAAGGVTRKPGTSYEEYPALRELELPKAAS